MFNNWYNSSYCLEEFKSSWISHKIWNEMIFPFCSILNDISFWILFSIRVLQTKSLECSKYYNWKWQNINSKILNHCQWFNGFIPTLSYVFIAVLWFRSIHNDDNYRGKEGSASAHGYKIIQFFCILLLICRVWTQRK